MIHKTTREQDRALLLAITVNGEEALDWVEWQFEPEEVFQEHRLERWAKQNGWKKS